MKSKNQGDIYEDIDGFIISEDMCSSPGDFPFFSFFAASRISLAEGGLVLIFRRKM